MWKVPLFNLDYGEEEKQAVLEVLESKWLTSGEKTKQFEETFSHYLGQGALSTSVSSATAALHIALMIAKVQQGDEVIISGLTFVADANVVTMLNARAVFADVNSLNDWNPSVEDILLKVTDKTKAIIVVHFAGYPIEDIQRLKQFCSEKDIILIEDVAHAVGSSYKNQKCGTFGDMACFSFFSNKNLSTGEGGMFVTANPEFDRQARLFRSHGMSSMTIERHQGKTISYDVIQPGLNYRFDEMRSALGLTQLAKLDQNNLKRKIVSNRYIEMLSTHIPSLTIPFTEISVHSESSYHIFPVLLPEACERLKVINTMKAQGIQTSIHYPSFKEFTYYAPYCKSILKNADQISGRVVTLPLYPGLPLDTVDEIVFALKEALA